MSQFISRQGVTAFVVALLFAQPAWAEGTEYTVRGHDLVVSVDSRWTGSKFGGGYYPLRVRVTNRGQPRNLTVRFTPNEATLPQVRRTIGADQNATVQFTLSVPMVGAGSYGTLDVLHEGRVLGGLSRGVSLPDLDYWASYRPAMLVISPNTVDTAMFSTAVDSLFAATGAASYGGHSTGTNNDAQVIPPLMLPDNWIDYSGLDLVAVPLDVLDKLDRDSRTAMKEWVCCGGTLIVYNVGGPPAESRALQRALGLAEHRFASDWQAADPRQRDGVPLIAPAAEAQAGMGTGAMPAGGPMTLLGRAVPPNAVPPNEAATKAFTWPESGSAFAWRNLMLGRIYAMEQNAFDGTASDWSWLLASLGPDRYRWSQRHGFASRFDNPEFLNFLIPNIRGVPVYAFLTLITLFTIAIGPLNYFLLWKRRQLFLLVLTIPIIAVVTSLSLFSYSMVSHGFGVKSRTRSLTFLDQRSKSAVAISRISLFAGLAPSSGLTFSPDTAVFPIWPGGESFEGGQVDWTETQSFGSGWLRSRTRTQFVTVSHQPARGRLILSPAADGKLNVENGFEWNIRAIIAADADGNLYAGGELPAGASTRIGQTGTGTGQSAELAAALKLLREQRLELPPNFSGSDYSSYSYRSRMYMYGGSPDQFRTSFATGQLERRLEELKKLGTDRQLPVENSYVVIFDENPGIELGVEGTEPAADLHVLVGYY